RREITDEAEERAYEAGGKLGLLREDMEQVLTAEIERLGAKRAQSVPPSSAETVPATATAPAAASVAADPATEFRRMLRLSKLCLEGDDMTDDQRDALCNMGESLGLTG